MAIVVKAVGEVDFSDFRKAQRELDKMRRSADTLDNRMRRLGRSFSDAGQKMKRTGSIMTRTVSAPIAALGGLAVRSAMDFETSMSRIEGLVGVASSEIDELAEAAKTLGPSYGVSANEAGEALFFITSAGLRGASAIEALDSALKASAVGLGDTATVADLLTSAVNAYGEESLGAAMATDVLTNAVRLGKLQPEELAGAMGQVLPVASAMGVEFHEVGAAFAAMSRTGTNAQVAATQLRQILATILKPTVEAEDALSGVGLASEELRTQLREKGLLSVLRTLVERFEGNAGATSAVFGNIRALSGVLDLMGSNIEATTDVFDGMSDSVGTTDEALKATSDTAAYQFRVALEEAKGAMMEAATEALPMLTDLAESLQGLVEDWRNLTDEEQRSYLKLAGFAAVAGPAIVVAGQLTTAVGGLATAFAFLAANPIVAVIAGLGGLIAYSIIAGKETRDYAYELGEATESHDNYAEALARARHGYPMLLEQMERERELHRFNAIRASQHADRLAELHEQLNRSADAEADRFRMMADRERDNRARRETEEILGELDSAFGDLGDTYGDVAERSVRLDAETRDLLRALNETYVGSSEAGDALAEYARELLAAGAVTEGAEGEIRSLASAIGSDLNEALRDAESRLSGAQQAFDSYRDSIAGGIREGNTLADAARRQDDAILRLAQAEEEYAAAAEEGDPERLAKAAEDLAAAKDAQKTFADFLEQNVNTAQNFAQQIDALREAGASLAVTQEIAQLGAQTGGRIIAELLAGGAAAIEQANALTAAVEAASIDAGNAAAQQFYGAGVRAAKALVDGVRSELDELDDLLERIVERITAAFDAKPTPSTGPSTTPSPTPPPTPPTPTPTPPDRANLGSWERRFGGGSFGGIRFFADGGLVTGPTLGVVGEAGPELVVPLDRAEGLGQTNISITVTSADPQAVVEAIRKYTRRNGPLGASVNV